MKAVGSLLAHASGEACGGMPRDGVVCSPRQCVGPNHTLCVIRTRGETSESVRFNETASVGCDFVEVTFVTCATFLGSCAIAALKI